MQAFLHHSNVQVHFGKVRSHSVQIQKDYAWRERFAYKQRLLNQPGLVKQWELIQRNHVLQVGATNSSL